MKPSIALLTLLMGSLSGAHAAVTVADLRTEYAANPLGIDVARPRLSWGLQSAERAQRQTAYRILVATSEERLGEGRADLWDSGRRDSGQSIQVEYGGRALVSRQRCYWKVRAWDKNGTPSPYSAVASWEMGLLSPKDWQGGWIGYPAGWPGRALYFRSEIEIHKPVRQARAYIAGLGYYELHLNGARVGDHVLDPGWTDYSRHVLYATYDVGGLLRPGKNGIGVIVGNGWYGMPKLLMQLEVTYADGDTETQFTQGGHGQPGWQVSSGPVLGNSIYDGETYDARLEKPGWDLPAASPTGSLGRTEGWETAFPVESLGGHLVSQSIDPIKIVATMPPKGMSQPKPGVVVYDTGQNLAGWAELRVSGEPGTRVTLRYAESLFEDGTVNQENLRKAAATDVYILKGQGREVWEPRFTYHGFRYVQLEGLPEPASLDALQIKVVRSSVDPNGVFATSSDLVNRIQKMVWWTEASNLHSVPTDCPQRDERMGWMNDLTVRLEEAIYNFKLNRFLPKFLDDVRDTQDAEGTITDTAPFRWGFRPGDPVSASYLLLAWLPYQHYGDLRSVAEHFDGLKAWTDYLARISKNGIVTYGHWGDWSPPRAFAIVGSLGTGAVSKDTPISLMSTGYLYYCSHMVALMAEALGREDDRLKYSELAWNVGEAFNREFWNENTGGYASNNQASNSFALYLGLVPRNRVPRVVDNLVRDVKAQDGHLTTGNLCTKYLLEALADNGRADVAYGIVTQTTYPSWGFMLANGATTLWERWEHMTGGQMNSHNHPMMGSVSAWFYKHLGGINTDPKGPGFKRFILRPQAVEGLDWVRAEYTSMYGTIRSQWRKENGVFWCKITVPVNTTATVYVPAAAPDQIREGGKRAVDSEGIRLLGTDNRTVVLEVGSGDYEFTVTGS